MEYVKNISSSWTPQIAEVVQLHTAENLLQLSSLTIRENMVTKRSDLIDLWGLQVIMRCWETAPHFSLFEIINRKPLVWANPNESILLYISTRFTPNNFCIDFFIQSQYCRNHTRLFHTLCGECVFSHQYYCLTSEVKAFNLLTCLLYKYVFHPLWWKKCLKLYRVLWYNYIS